MTRQVIYPQTPSEGSYSAYKEILINISEEFGTLKATACHTELPYCVMRSSECHFRCFEIVYWTRKNLCNVNTSFISAFKTYLQRSRKFRNSSNQETMHTVCNLWNSSYLIYFQEVDIWLKIWSVKFIYITFKNSVPNTQGIRRLH